MSARLTEADATEMMLRKQLGQLEIDLNDQRVKCSKHMASSSVEKVNTFVVVVVGEKQLERIHCFYS